jgi:two-component system sensor histidine kinase/response regulator
MNNIRILVVEDSLIISELVRNIFTMQSGKDGYQYEIILAFNGEQGLEQAQKMHPDIILLDIEMPKCNGYEMLNALRSTGNTTPVIIMTGMISQHSQVNKQAGWNAFITKPFRPSHLYNYVQQQLQQAAYR